jgi:hypothetical protein
MGLLDGRGIENKGINGLAVFHEAKWNKLSNGLVE